MSKINLSALEVYREVMGEDTDSFIADILQSYLNNSPLLLAQMEQALQASDVATFHRIAHTLKSSSATVGAVQMANLAADLEKATSTAFPENIEASLQELKREYFDVSLELSKLLRTHYQPIG